jgi:hypothetical protein
LAKKLKKKIEEACGLTSLDWEARQERATQILANLNWKQKLCNELLGLSFRELERILIGIANERQKKEDSYNQKLNIYKKDKIVKKNNNISNRPPPRSLEEILAQVYAPREEEKNDKDN